MCVVLDVLYKGLLWAKSRFWNVAGIRIARVFPRF